MKLKYCYLPLTIFLLLINFSCAHAGGIEDYIDCDDPGSWDYPECREEITVPGYLETPPLYFPATPYYMPPPLPEGNPNYQRPSKCDTMDRDFAQCNSNAQKIRLFTSSSCNYRTYSGLIGGGILAGAGAWFTGGFSMYAYFLAITGGAATGGGLGGYSANDCIRQAENILNVNLAICDSNRANTDFACRI